MNSNDWAKIWVPLAAELVRAAIGLIFKSEKKKREIARKYLPTTKGGRYEF